MPSPFPGMDPYLEGSLWTTFHFTFCAEIIRYLAPRLRPQYLALPVERLVLDETGDIAITSTAIYPDVSVVTPSRSPVEVTPRTPIDAPLQLATVIPQAIPHVSIEIRDVAGRQLVTAIELLSPTHKRGDGRLEYLGKRRRLLLSAAHLLELDLLRQSQHIPMAQPLPAAPYFVFLSRAERRPLLDIWPVDLDQPLPTVPIPLLPGDPDRLLDLQAVFDATYDLLGYDLMIDYRQPPDVPGDDASMRWIAARLQERGLRPAQAPAQAPAQIRASTCSYTVISPRASAA